MSSRLRAVELYLPANKAQDQKQIKSVKTQKNCLCLLRLHGLNQSLFFFISVDTAIFLWRIPVPPSAPAHTQVTLHLTLLFFFKKQVLSFFLHHWLLETLASRLFETSVPFLISLIVSDRSWHCILSCKP